MPGATRKAVELAAIFLAAGAVHTLVSVAGEQAYGPLVLIVIGLATVVGAFVFRWRPRRHLPPPRQGNLWLVRATIDDRPGRLAVLAGAMGALGCDIQSLDVQPSPAGVVDEMLVAAPPNTAESAIERAARSAGGREISIAPADVHELTDPSCRSLVLARQLVSGQLELPAAVSALLSADVRWQAEANPLRRPGFTHRERLLLNHPRSGIMVVRRPHRPFTATEYARARSLTDVAAALHSKDFAEPDRQK
ncbi:hypothetical protein [Fodinicola acaciae]|uniref:hypothetical protein n=1 Tax=Fodinicola acaciae TaxID=2681555 RepID=UPI0013D7BC63|nr:hypothetical protein [Fodinicola acaciae]